MKAIVIGCGRVGSNIARAAPRGRLGRYRDRREGGRARATLAMSCRSGLVSATVWTLTSSARRASRTPQAVAVATDGDNTNLVIGQVAQSFATSLLCWSALIDPRARRLLRGARPPHGVSDVDRDRRPSSSPPAPESRRRSGGVAHVHPRLRRRQVGANLARHASRRAGHELTLIEQRRRSASPSLEEEFEQRRPARRRDRALSSLEAAGIKCARPRASR